MVTHYFHDSVVRCEDVRPNGCAIEIRRQTALEAGILYGAGGLLLASGGVMFFLAPSDSPASPRTATARSAVGPT